jgi:hypothetical protein
MTIYEAIGRRWRTVYGPEPVDPEDDTVLCKALDDGELRSFRWNDLRAVALVDTKGELNEALD